MNTSLLIIDLLLKSTQFHNMPNFVDALMIHLRRIVKTNSVTYNLISWRYDGLEQ
jgi:hypothetical protein